MPLTQFDQHLALQLSTQMKEGGLLFGKDYEDLNKLAAQRADTSISGDHQQRLNLNIQRFVLEKLSHPACANFLQAIGLDRHKLIDNDYLAVFDEVVSKAQRQNMLPKRWLSSADYHPAIQADEKFPSSAEHRFTAAPNTQPWAGHHLLYRPASQDKPAIRVSAISLPMFSRAEVAHINSFYDELSNADSIVSIVDWPSAKDRVFNYTVITPETLLYGNGDEVALLGNNAFNYAISSTSNQTNSTQITINNKISNLGKTIPILSIPVPDMTPFQPNDELLASIDQLLQRGGNIYVHCESSVGRTGQFMHMLACLFEQTIITDLKNLLNDADNALLLAHVAQKMTQALSALRSIRYMIQAPEQLDASVNVLVAMARQELLIDEQLTQFNDYAATINHHPDPLFTREQRDFLLAAKLHSLHRLHTRPDVSATLTSSPLFNSLNQIAGASAQDERLFVARYAQLARHALDTYQHKATIYIPTEHASELTKTWGIIIAINQGIKDNEQQAHLAQTALLDFKALAQKPAASNIALCAIAVLQRIAELDGDSLTACPLKLAALHSQLPKLLAFMQLTQRLLITLNNSRGWQSDAKLKAILAHNLTTLMQINEVLTVGENTFDVSINYIGDVILVNANKQLVLDVSKKSSASFGFFSTAAEVDTIVADYLANLPLSVNALQTAVV